MTSVLWMKTNMCNIISRQHITSSHPEDDVHRICPLLVNAVVRCPTPTQITDVKWIDLDLEQQRALSRPACRPAVGREKIPSLPFSPEQFQALRPQRGFADAAAAGLRRVQFGERL